MHDSTSSQGETLISNKAKTMRSRKVKGLVKICSIAPKISPFSLQTTVFNFGAMRMMDATVPRLCPFDPSPAWPLLKNSELGSIDSNYALVTLGVDADRQKRSRLCRPEE
jgi:hypothetical protein